MHQQINSAKGEAIPAHISEEHASGEEEHRRKTIGEIELEKENARRQEMIDRGEAKYNILLHGRSAKSFAEKVSRNIVQSQELSQMNICFA